MRNHGIATFVRNGLPWAAAGQSPNIYKPPPSRLAPSTLPDVPAPAVYTGDLNSHHTNWGYSNFNTDGDSLVDWASTVYATLLYDPKELLFLLCTLEQLH